MTLLQWGNGCTGEKFEDLVDKICCFVISDGIKTGLSAVCCDVTTYKGNGNRWLKALTT